MSKIDLTGKKFGELTVLYETAHKHNKRHWVVICSCGVTKSVRQHSLTSGGTTTCGHLTELTGMVYSRLTVISESDKINGVRMWNVLCECGNCKAVRHDALVCGSTKSCGCLNRERLSNGLSKRHGESGTRLYACWYSMKTRSKKRDSCNVHDDFGTFEKFRDWSLANGYDDSKVMCRNGDVGDYAPDNVRWDTHKSNDTEAHGKHWHIIDPDGIEYHIFGLAEFCREHNLNEKGMSRVGRGERPLYKGWHCELINLEEV
ncbi:hypothetical protein NVP3058O_075 [Vibrio phage 3.058.O._10N.286.46.B8]|nr:hypothetical protein NVP2058O_076 [Vibrio phage 2.058.O._10N.286.46.B8]AUS03145.1 hypothetical protein NVP3058O_075 [Vibrio phage 3.058.O._10N.286.46.B8]